MIVKYKVSDFAKDLNLSAKKVLDELNAMGSTGKKNSSNLEENELNYLLEKFSKDNSVANLDEFLNSAKAAKEEPKPTEKKAEKKPEKKPEAPKAEKKPEQPAAKKAEPAQQDKNGNKHNEKKNEQHKKREEKTVSLSELARETGAKASAAPAQAVSVRREDNQVTVDTRTVDMNVDRFDARYDDLASTKNTENRRKPTPQGNKQKFTQRGQRQRQQFQKGKRETEFERLQRIQLEKARSAQLKVMIPDEITVGELAARLKQQAGKVIAKFMQMGEMHAINDIIDFDTASLRGRLAAVLRVLGGSQIVVTGIKAVHVHIHGTGIHGDLIVLAADGDGLGRGSACLGTGLTGQLAQGDGLLLTLLMLLVLLLVMLAVIVFLLGLLGSFCRLRLLLSRLLGGLGLCLFLSGLLGFLLLGLLLRVLGGSGLLGAVQISAQVRLAMILAEFFRQESAG